MDPHMLDGAGKVLLAVAAVIVALAALVGFAIGKLI